MLPELVPADMVRLQTPADWKKVTTPPDPESSGAELTGSHDSQAIVSAHTQDAGMSQEEAKIAFLRYVYKWQTFGSAFFEVKVSLETSA